MTHTEAMQLIKRTQCKLRPSSSPTLPFDQSSEASVIAMASPKSGEKQVRVGRVGAPSVARPIKFAPAGLHLLRILCANSHPATNAATKNMMPQQYSGSIICIAFSPRTTIGRSAKGISPLPIAQVEGRRRAHRYLPGAANSLRARKANGTHQINLRVT